MFLGLVGCARCLYACRALPNAQPCFDAAPPCACSTAELQALVKRLGGKTSISLIPSVTHILAGGWVGGWVGNRWRLHKPVRMCCR